MSTLLLALGLIVALLVPYDAGMYQYNLNIYEILNNSLHFECYPTEIFPKVLLLLLSINYIIFNATGCLTTLSKVYGK